MNERQPTLRTDLLLLAGLLIFVFASGFFQVSDCDVGYHLRTGAHILAGHGIPTTNTFSSATPAHPWLLHQWLGAIVFYLAFALSGVASLIAFKALVAVLIMCLAWLRARAVARAGSWWPFWVVTAGTVAARVRFFERPDLLSAWFFALLLYLDGRWDQNRRWQWFGLPLLMAAWANTHAGVVYGFAFLAVLAGCEWLELGVEALRTRGRPIAGGSRTDWLKSLVVRPAGLLVSLLVSCLAVEAMNPNGWRVLWFPVSQFTSKFWQGIILEYQPPTWSGEKAFYMFFGGLILLQVLTAKRIHWRLLLVSAAFGYLACRSQRSLLFFIIAGIPHATYLLDCLWPNHVRNAGTEPGPLHEKTGGMDQRGVAGRPVPSQDAALERPGGLPDARTLAPATAWRWQAGLLLATWLLLVLLVFVPDRTFRFGVGWYHPYYPLEIYQFLAQEVPPQGVFNEMRYGGSMLWWLYPRFKPFIDGRGDAYSEEFWLRDYLPVLDAKPGWREVMKKYDLHCVLLPLPDSGEPLALARTLFSDPQWALVGFNDYAVLFLERTETNRPIVERCEFKVLRPGEWSFPWVDAPDKRDQGAAETRRALRMSPDSRFARTAAARVFMVSGQLPQAAEELGGILQDYPEAGELYWRDYGYVLCRLDRVKEADKIFSHMIRNRQLMGYAYFMKYHLALMRHDATAAERFLSRALELEPSNAEYRQERTNFDQATRVK